MSRPKTRKTARIALVLMIAALGGIGTSVILSGGAAIAQEAEPTEPYSSEEPTVLPTRIIDPGDPKEDPDEPAVLPNRLNRDQGNLPFTGADITVFVATGFTAIGTGALLVRRRRGN